MVDESQRPTTARERAGGSRPDTQTTHTTPGLVEVVDESQRPTTARERAAADPTRAPPQLGSKGLSRASVLATNAYGAQGVSAALTAAEEEEDGEEVSQQLLRAVCELLCVVCVLCVLCVRARRERGAVQPHTSYYMQTNSQSHAYY